MKKKIKNDFSNFKNEVDFCQSSDFDDAPPSLLLKYINSAFVDRSRDEKLLDLIEFKIKKKILVNCDEYSKLEALAHEAFVRFNLMKFHAELESV